MPDYPGKAFFAWILIGKKFSAKERDPMANTGDGLFNPAHAI